MTWTIKHLPADKPNTYRMAISQSGATLSYEQVFAKWSDDTNFRSFYIGLLLSASSEAIFWEVPPVTLTTLQEPYECIVADSPALAQVDADPSAFASHFHTADNEPIIAFENLGGDAMLVVPCPLDSESDYPHLSAFLREAPESQRHAFFERLSDEISKRISNQPLWISTSGLGVYWLHARLDSVPKYYTYAPYRSPPR